MRSASLLLLSACWTGGSATPQATPVSSRPSGRCEITDHGVTPPEPVNLTVNGKAFASFGEMLQRLEVTIAGSKGRAVVETELVELDAEIDLEHAPVRPQRMELRDGWLEVSRAQARAATGDSVRIDVRLPAGFTPPFVSLDVKCNQLTFAEPPTATSEPDNTRWVEIKPGVDAKLRAVIGGPVVATVTGLEHTDGADDIAVIEQRGPLVRLRYPRPNSVTVWTDANAVQPAGGTMFGGLMGNMVGVAGHRIQCQRPVPLYVRVGSEEVRVGRLKPNVKFPPEYRGGDLELDLGVEDVKPYVKKADLPACLGSQ